VRKKVKLIILQSGATAGLTLGLGYFFLNQYGLAGAGMAYALAHFLVALTVLKPLLVAIKEERGAIVLDGR
jgi:hypothetical protein